MQEQLLLKTSAEKFSDPSTQEKLAQMAKEEGMKKFLGSTTVDMVNNKVHIEYLYDEKKLPELGENFYGATKRVTRVSAIPYRNNASGDYAACTKDATVLTYLADSPVELQKTIRQSLIKHHLC